MSNSLLLRKSAPHFTAKAVVGQKIVDDFSLSDLQGKYILFFFYPLDFTFVCPTELHAFQSALGEFKKRGAEVIGCSVDSCFSHLAWLNTPKEQGGIAGIEFPLVSDLNKNISRSYHVLNEEEGIAYRGLFLIDKAGLIRHILINDLPLGRSVDEALRTLEALVFTDTHGEVCPANWNKGKKTLKPDAEGIQSYFKASTL